MRFSNRNRLWLIARTVVSICECLNRAALNRVALNSFRVRDLVVSPSGSLHACMDLITIHSIALSMMSPYLHHTVKTVFWTILPCRMKPPDHLTIPLQFQASLAAIRGRRAARTADWVTVGARRPSVLPLRRCSPAGQSGLFKPWSVQVFSFVLVVVRGTLVRRTLSRNKERLSGKNC